MKIEIKCRFSARVIYSGDHADLRSAVEAAVKAGVNLARANLAGANLSEANLFEANLARANLAGANLARVNLAGVNLARANLARANLAGANLFEANLARANLFEANLAEATGSICNSHEMLAAIAIRFDASLVPVASMIAGGLVGCWQEYTDAIRSIFGEEVMKKLRVAWSQDESWGVVDKMNEYGWPEVRA